MPAIHATRLVFALLTGSLLGGCSICGHPVPPHRYEMVTGTAWTTVTFADGITCEMPNDGPMEGYRPHQAKRNQYTGTLLRVHPFGGIWEPRSLVRVTVAIEHTPHNVHNATEGEPVVYYNTRRGELLYVAVIRLARRRYFQLECRVVSPLDRSEEYSRNDSARLRKVESVIGDIVASIAVEGQPIIERANVQFLYRRADTRPHGFDTTDQGLCARHAISLQEEGKP